MYSSFFLNTGRPKRISQAYLFQKFLNNWKRRNMQLFPLGMDCQNLFKKKKVKLSNSNFKRFAKEPVLRERHLQIYVPCLFYIYVWINKHKSHLTICFAHVSLDLQNILTSNRCTPHILEMYGSHIAYWWRYPALLKKVIWGDQLQTEQSSK